MLLNIEKSEEPDGGIISVFQKKTKATDLKFNEKL